MRDPLLVLSDVHLSKRAAPEVAGDLARLVREHRGHEVVLAGDVFDLSHAPASRDPAESLLEVVRPHTSLRDALRAHLVAGDALTLIAGNHDAATTVPRVKNALLDWLELRTEAPLAVTPWFVRRGGVHIEHGHLYDPDNAPTHPLAPWSPKTDPLGIQLTRRFLVPNDVFAFAHAHETTPAAGLARVFRLYGVRAPLIVLRYFATAIRICTEAGRQPGLSEERAKGAQTIASFADEVGLDADLLHELSVARPTPTHHELASTFMRLYFDRIIATLVLGSAAAAAVAGSTAGAGLAAVSAAYLGYSLSHGTGRYNGLPEVRLRDAAQQIAKSTRADLVVFGHTHLEDEAPRYLNAGSFAYSRRPGRPYLVIDGATACAERRELSR